MNKYDVVIVGGGMAGLTAQAYIAREGYKSILLEKNNICGGLVNSFRKDGFIFDAGVRALEDAGIIIPMLKELDIELDFVKSPVSVGIKNKIIDVESINDIDAYEDLLKSFYSDNKRDIRKIIKFIKKIMKHMDVLYGIENPIFKDILKDREFLFKKLIPWILNLLQLYIK